MISGIVKMVIYARRKRIGFLTMFAAILTFILFVGFIGALVIKVCYWILATFIFQNYVCSGSIPSSLGWMRSFWIWLGLDLFREFILDPGRSRDCG